MTGFRVDRGPSDHLLRPGGNCSQAAPREPLCGGLVLANDHDGTPGGEGRRAPDWLIEAGRGGGPPGPQRPRGGFGQALFTGHELEAIDVSKGRASAPHAEAVKAALTQQGVGDRLAHYDPKLTVDDNVGALPEIDRSTFVGIEGARKLAPERKKCPENTPSNTITVGGVMNTRPNTPVVGSAETGPTEISAVSRPERIPVA